MSTIAFDTHRFIKILEGAGFNEKQAEAVAEAVSHAHVEAEIASKADIKELEYRLIIKLGAMMVTAVTVVAVLVKLL